MSKHFSGIGESPGPVDAQSVTKVGDVLPSNYPRSRRGVRGSVCLSVRLSVCPRAQLKKTVVPTDLVFLHKNGIPVAFVRLSGSGPPSSLNDDSSPLQDMTKHDIRVHRDVKRAL